MLRLKGRRPVTISFPLCMNTNGRYFESPIYRGEISWNIEARFLPARAGPNSRFYQCQSVTIGG